ncbi:alpha/beta fold hydrolase [Allokutzneria oryzae]|uniref:Alpha/beta fold hydrolase n=1 Tax=Allokutzneria oryzae TaxID=1378989 RepID=A0ABV5ZXQ8_9PSEU
MSTYVLVHGAADRGWCWHLVADRLRALGHEVVAPDLPCDDDTAGFAEYAEAVVEAVGARTDLVVVGHSLGGYTAPIVAERLGARMLVLVAAMVPEPGERAMDMLANTGYQDETTDPDALLDVFYHDVPPELAAQAQAGERAQSTTPMTRPWPLAEWPRVPTRFLLCRDDRLFTADWLRGVVRARLGFDPDEMGGGHYIQLSRPVELAERLAAY